MNGRQPDVAEKDPITFLRKFSNYLAPQLGLLSLDTWVIFTIWLRNTILNQMIVLVRHERGVAVALVLGNFARSLVNPAPGSGTGCASA